ncbi:hypothetical protein [Streptomyces carminius]|uniref:hypothetical protein n=1 Tax=Streptomyces carminius TaxID=2665496 RepID=UPI0011B72A97|nr:hypothetical protein [Streptomyces carminius]
MDDLGYVPTVVGVQEARDRTGELSSQVLDAIGVKGKITEPGPGVSVCPADPKKEKLYRVRHPWALYGIPDSSLEKGMANLREKLPKNGWKIIADREAESEDRDPVIHAEHEEMRYALDVVWERETAEHDPQISVTLLSACFETPEGESPQGEF